MRPIQAYSVRLEAIGQEIRRLERGDPEGDMRRRLTAGCARMYILRSDRPNADRQTLFDLTDPPPQDHRYRYRYPFYLRVPDPEYFPLYASRKGVLMRIAQGGLGIEDKVGVWNGSFWAGLRASGAIRKGPGTEFRIWERLHGELVADIAEMPLMHRLEPKAAKHGQRRLRRCYAAFLPHEQSTEGSLLAGLFAGAALCAEGGETWLELPDDQGVRAVLEDWGLPFKPLEHPKGRRLVRVSPLFGQLGMHLMPPRSAARMLAVRKAGGCPFLSVVLWQMAMTRKNGRYMPFSKAVPFGVSKATFFRRGWRRRDLNRAGWLDLGIRITPKLRELLVEWHHRTSEERQHRPCGSSVA